jgi:hypothetical protein
VRWLPAEGSQQHSQQSTVATRPAGAGTKSNRPWSFPRPTAPNGPGSARGSPMSTTTSCIDLRAMKHVVRGQGAAVLAVEDRRRGQVDLAEPGPLVGPSSTAETLTSASITSGWWVSTGSRGSRGGGGPDGADGAIRSLAGMVTMHSLSWHSWSEIAAFSARDPFRHCFTVVAVTRRRVAKQFQHRCSARGHLQMSQRLALRERFRHHNNVRSPWSFAFGFLMAAFLLAIVLPGDCSSWRGSWPAL